MSVKYLFTELLPSSTTGPSTHMMSQSIPKVTRVQSTLRTFRSTTAATAGTSAYISTHALEIYSPNFNPEIEEFNQTIFDHFKYSKQHKHYFRSLRLHNLNTVHSAATRLVIYLSA